MQLAMIGLGRMGGNMVERLMRHGHELVVFDRTPDTVAKYESARRDERRRPRDRRPVAASAANHLDHGAGRRSGGSDDRDAIPHAVAGDMIIDGGNSNFHDTIRRGQQLAQSKIELIDSGTSGGIWGLENGYCLMVGGSDTAVKHCEPIFTALAPENGYAHVGPTGSGHYVKMVHNGIEYGLLQAYAEGYEILHASKTFPKLDLEQISEVWQHGSVVRSWLNELAGERLRARRGARRRQGLGRRLRRRDAGPSRKRSTSTSRRR